MSRRRLIATLLWLVAVAVAGGLGVWAGRSTTAPAAAPDSTPGAPVYTVTAGSVGQSMQFPVGATWDSAPLPAGSASGVLTSIASSGTEPVKAGDIVYTVDLRPVTVITGATPSFRDLSLGATGPDVAQLRDFLRSAGYLSSGSTSNKFDAATSAAVRRWQKEIRVESDGVVRAGDVIFTPTLPVRVQPIDDVAVGDRVESGDKILDALSPSPRFTISLSAEQAAIVPTDGPVVVAGHGYTWKGVIAAAVQEEDKLVLTLTAEGGQPLCGADCAAISPPTGDGALVFQATMVIVPETEGLVVPVAALGVDPAGAHYVTTADGARVPVTIVASSKGLAVVTGLAEGDALLLFGDTGPTPPGTPADATAP